MIAVGSVGTLFPRMHAHHPQPSRTCRDTPICGFSCRTFAAMHGDGEMRRQPPFAGLRSGTSSGS